MKIIIDAFGGDYSPDEMIKGAIISIKQFEELTIVLSGDEAILKEKIALLKLQKQYEVFDEKRLEILDAKEVISCNEKPTDAIRTKKESSLVKAFDLLKSDDKICGVISSGSTGAVLTGAFMKIGRMKGILRPTLCPALPTLKGTPVVITDSGANMDCKKENLLQFALMGSKYYEAMYGKKEPRVALLNVGVEEEKGNELIKSTFEEMKKLPINFVGNMEARDCLSGDYDVVVADGFAGNMLLKASEGAALTVITLLKNTLKNGSLKTKIGGLMIKKDLKVALKSFDYSNHGGSPFLGINKIIMKTHGSAKEKTIFECVKQVIKLSSSNYNEGLKDMISSTKIEVGQE